MHIATEIPDGDRLLAKAPSTCCLKGVIANGEPRGSLTVLSDVETYVSPPDAAKTNGNIVIYFADIFGLSTNGRLIMDSFAGAGYLVLGLDYFRGDTITKHMDKDNNLVAGFDFEAWKAQHAAFADEAVPKWFDAVRTQYGRSHTKYACVGFCFGAPYVCDGLAGDTFAAGAFAHPASLKEHHFENLKKPLLLSCASQDVAFDTSSRRKAVDILQSQGKVYQVQLLSGVEHGFALRGDITNPYERYTKEQSLIGTITWLNFWLSQ